MGGNICMANSKITTKIIIGFTLLTIIIAVMGVTSYIGISRLKNSMEDLIKVDAKSVESAQRLRANINMLRRYEKDLFLNAGVADKVAEYRKKWNETLEHANK